MMNKKIQEAYDRGFRDGYRRGIQKKRYILTAGEAEKAFESLAEADRYIITHGWIMLDDSARLFAEYFEPYKFRVELSVKDKRMY